MQTKNASGKIEKGAMGFYFLWSSAAMTHLRWHLAGIIREYWR